ncbi:hypothetical protein BD626DRAFT_448880 [Schizophyllum amplum]|uniref:Uncharacterized protein n=1 Tax=Schizophyllum amplum TaxID=97359 RepID=A0A550D008_9AGAR|nr:hypothetical protein BD626DRAFT_448880 [Auriculariopsis ampla]
MAPRGRQPHRLADHVKVEVKDERPLIGPEPQYQIDIERWRQQVEQEWTMAEEVEREDAEMALEQHLSELGCKRAPSNALADSFFGLDGAKRPELTALESVPYDEDECDSGPGSPLQRVRTIKRAGRVRRLSAWEATPSPKDLPLPHIAYDRPFRERRAPAWQDSPDVPDLPPPEVIFGHRVERRLEDAYMGHDANVRSPSMSDRRFMSSGRQVPDWQASPETPALPSPEVLFANHDGGYETPAADGRHRRTASVVEERGVKRLAPRALGGSRGFAHMRGDSESAVLRRPSVARPEYRPFPMVQSPTAVSSLSPALGDQLLPPLEESLFSWEFPTMDGLEEMDDERVQKPKVLRKRSSKGVKRPFQNAFSGDEGAALDVPPRARKLARAPRTPLADRQAKVLTKSRPQKSAAQEYADGERRREEMRRELMENVLGMRC